MTIWGETWSTVCCHRIPRLTFRPASVSPTIQLSITNCSAAVVRSTHESAALPAAHGVLDRLPEASDFSQKVRHLNSVSREAETLTAAFYKPAPSLRQACVKPASRCYNDCGGCASLPLDDQNFFIFAQNTPECLYVCSLGRSWRDFCMQLRAS